MHHLIKSMRKCLRKAISTDGGFIYYLQFVLLYCLMPIFVLNYCLFFYFILQLAVIFIFIIRIVILSLIIIAKILKKFNSSQFPRLYIVINYYLVSNTINKQ